MGGGGGGRGGWTVIVVLHLSNFDNSVVFVTFSGP